MTGDRLILVPISAERAWDLFIQTCTPADRGVLNVSFDYFLDAHVAPYGLYERGELVGIACIANYGDTDTDLYPVKAGYTPEQSSLMARLESGYIVPNHRGKGYHTVLIAEREKLARVRGFEYTYMSIHPDNQYSKRGALASGYSCEYAGVNSEGEPREVYFKKL